MRRKFEQRAVSWVMPERDKLAKAMGLPVEYATAAFQQFAALAPHQAATAATQAEIWMQGVNKAASGAPFRRGLLLLGPPGLGKTTMLAALCFGFARWRLTEALNRDDHESLLRWSLRLIPEHNTLRERGGLMNPSPIQYWSWARFWDKIQKTSRRSDPYTEVDYWDETKDMHGVVCFDDVQAGTFTEHKEQFLCAVAEGPQAGVTTLLTANTPDAENPLSLVSAFGDRIVDRLLDSKHWLIIRMVGESLRGA